MDLRVQGALLENILKEQGTEKFTYVLVLSEKQELNVESGSFKLMRTTFNKYGSVRVYENDRMGNVSGNDLSEEGLRKLAEGAKTAAQSAEEDPCHDLAPGQGSDVFRQGVLEPDLDKFIFRIREFLDAVAKEYPTVRVISSMGSYDCSHWYSNNSNGTEFEAYEGQYSFSIEISATDGETTTSADYTGFCTKDLDTPFLEMGDLKSHIENIAKSIYPTAMEGKFEGCMVLTPGAAANFLGMLIGNYTSDTTLIEGTSQWLDKVGEQVCDEKLTVTFDPYDERIVIGERGTRNGFRSEKVTLIDKGVLTGHRLSLYGAKKTGRPVMKNTGWDLIVEPGDTSFEDMIASIEKGILVGYYSGGSPGTNGEFSGVAKNSFLIENGKITGAVTETMINGNLGEAFRHIRSISKEQLADGGSVVPYIALDGIVVSGK
ncbi:MAG: TldD/PmbA family protein [Lachnospiraceae bacterium]|nr:TldD/PmbA family protein [Lachnospiraceae bacterium]